MIENKTPSPSVLHSQTRPSDFKPHLRFALCCTSSSSQHEGASYFIVSLFTINQTNKEISHLDRQHCRSDFAHIKLPRTTWEDIVTKWNGFSALIIPDFWSGCRLCAAVTGRRPQAWPWTRRGFPSHLALWSGIPQEEQQRGAAGRDIWKVLISLLSHWQAAYSQHREESYEVVSVTASALLIFFPFSPFCFPLWAPRASRCFSMSSRDRQCRTRRTESSRRTWIPTKRRKKSLFFIFNSSFSRMFGVTLALLTVLRTDGTGESFISVQKDGGEDVSNIYGKRNANNFCFDERKRKLGLFISPLGLIGFIQTWLQALPSREVWYYWPPDITSHKRPSKLILENILIG